MADDVVQLIHAYAEAAPAASVTDRREPVQVRSYALRCIRATGLSAAHFESAAAAMVEVLAAESSLNLRVQAALALGWFVAVRGVLAETRSNLDADGSQCEDGVSQRWRSAVPQ